MGPFRNSRIMSRLVYGAGGMLLILALAACGAARSVADEVIPTIPQPTPTFTPLAAAQQPTAIPTLEITPASAFNLVIWWPEPLAPVDRPDVITVLDQQIGSFDMAEGGETNIEFRRKRVQDVGGIMTTLRTASTVAPGALPDLTLIRREDLITAAQAGLIQPLDDILPAGTLDDLYEPLTALGMVDGQIYGLPYIVDVSLLVYYAADVDDDAVEVTPQVEDDEAGAAPPWTFNHILDHELEWVFPAGRATGVNTVFLIQYLEAGGVPLDAASTMTLNPDAVRSVLEFYEQLARAGLISAEVFEYTSARDYFSSLVGGSLNAAVVDSSMYLQMRADDVPLLAAPIPTESGRAASVTNGWMWVVPTSSAERQTTAARFLSWMMESDRHREFAEAIYGLPSQRTALQSLDDELVDVYLLNAIASSPATIPPDGSSGTLARAMQNALIAVITGQSTAEDATRTVIEQSSG
jgi:ABC-type glycerol-3-phosphate transport system substrate-binding protein